jgi:hypothetical protein
MSLVLIVNILFCAAVVVGIVVFLGCSIRASQADGQHFARRLRAERAAAPAGAHRARRAGRRGGYARPYAS